LESTTKLSKIKCVAREQLAVASCHKRLVQYIGSRSGVKQRKQKISGIKSERCATPKFRPSSVGKPAASSEEAFANRSGFHRSRAFAMGGSVNFIQRGSDDPTANSSSEGLTKYHAHV